MRLMKIFGLLCNTLILASCSFQSMSLEQAAKECRPAGDWTWTNFLDAQLQDNTLRFNAINLNGNQLDPDPICVLEKLGADESVLQGVIDAASSTTYGAEWDGITVESQRVSSGEEDLYDIWITKK